MQKIDPVAGKIIVSALGITAGYFFVVKPILEKTGIKESSEEIETKKKTERQEKLGYWNPVARFMKSIPKNKKAYLLKVADAKRYAKDIHESWGIFDDDEPRIYKTFRALTYQTQVPSLVSAYGDLYNIDLLTDLQKRLSEEEFGIVTKIIDQLKRGIA